MTGEDNIHRRKKDGPCVLVCNSNKVESFVNVCRTTKQSVCLPFHLLARNPDAIFSQLLDCECYADKHYIENTANSAQLKLLSALITFDSLMEPYCILHVLSPQLYLLWVFEVWGMSEYRDIELITCHHWKSYRLLTTALPLIWYGICPVVDKYWMFSEIKEMTTFTDLLHETW